MMPDFAAMIRHIATLLGLMTSNYNEKAAEEGLRECARGVRKLNKAMKLAKTMGEKQHLEASLRNVRSFRNQFKIQKKKGAGISTRPEGARERVHWDDSISAFSSRIRTGVISNLKHKDPKLFLVDCGKLFKRRIYKALKKEPSIKVNATFCGEFEIVKGDKVLKEFKYFTTSNAPIYQDTDLGLWFDEKVTEPIMVELEEFQERDSGWALIKVLNLGININKFTPQLGSSYIVLPPQIAARKACVNVKNDDQECFAWAVMSALFPVEKDPQRLSKYPDPKDVLKLKGIQFPMTLKQIPNFEKQNDVSINVYSLHKKNKNFQTVPTYLTKDKKDRHVNLLLIQNKYDEEEEDNMPAKYHYVWIKNLSRLVSSQLSKHKCRKFICDRCLHYYHTEYELSRHIEDCKKINETAIKMPNIGKNTLKFKNYKNKEREPFIVYADLESGLKPITEDPKKTQPHYFSLDDDDDEFVEPISLPTKSVEDKLDAVKSESLDDDDDDEFVEAISLPTKSVEDKLDAVKSESLDDDDDDEFVEAISLPTKSVEDKLDAVKSESLDDDDDEFVEPISLPKDIVNPMETGLQPVMAGVPNLLIEILLIQKENLRVCEEILQLERKRMDVERKRMELAHQKLEDELNLL